MKKLFSLIVLLSLILNVQSQTITKEIITGTWTVSDVIVDTEEIPEEQQKYIEEMKTAFLAAKLIFSENQEFTMDIPMPEMAANMKDVFWKLNLEKDYILIQESAEDSSTEEGMLVFHVHNEDGMYHFDITRMPFKLTVKKEA